METFGLRRYHSHHWSLADWIAYICALAVIYLVRSAAEKYFPNIGETKLKVISMIIIVIAVIIANAVE